MPELVLFHVVRDLNLGDVILDALVTVAVVGSLALLLRAWAGRIIAASADRAARLAVALMEQTQRAVSTEFDDKDRARVARLEGLMQESAADRAVLHEQLAQSAADRTALHAAVERLSGQLERNG